MQRLTMEEATEKHVVDLEVNRALGVKTAKTGEPRSDKVFEVTDGYLHLGDGQRLGPGHRFHPTVRQAETKALRGKARELTRSEMMSVPSVRGADIGLRSLPMGEGALRVALEAKLVEEDFAGVEPGHGGRFTRAQVEEIAHRKGLEA